jgi:hypothetical protein
VRQATLESSASLNLRISGLGGDRTVMLKEILAAGKVN